ncbi:MAG: carbohydrate porin [Gemmataceae bacterium]
MRPRLKESGITFEGNITQFGFGLGGGIDRPLPLFPALSQGNTGAYTGRNDYTLTFDLEKFGGLPHGKLIVGAQHWYGQYGNISFNTGSFPPAVFPAALPPRPDDQGIPYLTDFYLLQPLSKEWVVFAGKKNVIGAADQDDFAGGNGIEQFMNQALIANPSFLLGLPYTSFTVGVVSPREWGSFSAFIYDPQDRTQNAFDDLSSLFSRGIIIGGEVKLKTNFFNLPGEQHVGGIWKHHNLTDLRFNEPPPGVYPEPTVPGFPTLSDSYTIYYGADQYFQVYDTETKRGWGAFGRASISDGNPTPIRYFLSAGIGGYSPVRYREGDKFGVGFYFTGMSQEFGPLPQALVGPRDGYGLEMFYNAQITPWMNLTPDFQIVKPEGGAIAKTAYIGGVRLNLKF